MMASMPQGSTEEMKQMEEAMKGYHDLVDHGSARSTAWRREKAPRLRAQHPRRVVAHARQR
jgi:hypothetical protein